MPPLTVDHVATMIVEGSADPVLFSAQVVSRVVAELEGRRLVIAERTAAVVDKGLAAEKPVPSTAVAKVKVPRPGRALVVVNGVTMTKAAADRLARLKGWASSANPQTKAEPEIPAPASQRCFPPPRQSRAGQDSKPTPEPKKPAPAMPLRERMEQLRTVGSAAQRAPTQDEKQRWRDGQGAPEPAKAGIVIDPDTGKRRLSATIEGAHVTLGPPPKRNDFQLGPSRPVED